jgi:hypothetical protein
MIPDRHDQKLLKRINRLMGWRYKKVADVPLEFAETMEHFRKPPADLKYRPAPLGARWGKEWGTAWFRGALHIPRECKSKRVYYRMLTWGKMLLFVRGKAGGVF